MRFNIMSDLHLEFSKGNMEGVPEGDVLLLAGDIGIAHKPETYMHFLKSMDEQFEHVVMIMGNHEHYDGDFNKSYDRIKEATSKLTNFTLLENEVLELDETTVIIGSTLWSDIDPQHEFEIANGMNDFRIIDNFSTTVAKATFNNSAAFIEEQLEIYNNYETVVVMTHHAPSLQVPEIYRGNSLNSAYGSDLEYMIEAMYPSLWVHGHTHVSRNYLIGQTPIVCNPRGYAGHDLNREFNVNLGVKI